MIPRNFYQKPTGRGEKFIFFSFRKTLLAAPHRILNNNRKVVNFINKYQGKRCC